MGNLFGLGAKINGQIFPRANRQFVFFPENIGEEQKKKGFHVRICPVFLENIGEEQKKVFTSAYVLFSSKISVKSKKKVVTSADVHILISETSAAAFPLTRFRDMVCVP